MHLKCWITATMLDDKQISKWLLGEKKDRGIIPMGYVGSPAAYHQIHSTSERYCIEIAKEIMKHYI